MHRIIVVDISSDLSKVPNLDKVLPEEFKAAERLRAQGVLEHVFPKTGGLGTILVFKGADEEQVKEYLTNFPLAAHFGIVQYTPAEKAF